MGRPAGCRVRAPARRPGGRGRIPLRPCLVYTILPSRPSTASIGLPLTSRRVYNHTIMTRSRTIEIVEVGPRDGLQNEPGNLPLPLKREFIERIVGAGFKRIEVASFVNPKRVPQMADADALVRTLPRSDGVR